LIAASAPAQAAFPWPDEAPETLGPPPAAATAKKRVIRSAQGLPIGQRPGRQLRADRNLKRENAAKDVAKPHGPLIITVSIAKQHLRVYDANGLFAESPVSTGKPGHPTPMGVFSVIQKSRLHHSNIYSGAPMPYMQRITWSGVAMHAGVLPGYPASHGCIRMPMAFAVKLWGWTKPGARVIVAPDDVVPSDLPHAALLADLSPARPAVPPTAAPPVATTVTADKAAIAETSTKPPVPPTGTPAGLDTPLPEATLRPTLTDRVEVADAESDLPSLPGVRSDAQPGPVASGQKTSETDSVTPPVRDNSEASQQTAAAPVSTAPPIPALVGDKAARAEPSTPAVSQTRPAAVAPANAAISAPKRSGHVAVLISRKEGRIFVRQNFEPWFDAPVTITQNDRPLGTHVFTARADASDPGSYRWSVISLPQLPKRRVVAADEPPARHKRPIAAVEPEPLPPPPAEEILGRLKIPTEVVTRIATVLAPGGSIIVSDQGLGGETGLGTDFIVLLR
jgi:lipoprotein-anchoring transpeptidase ErfK/SrfK